MPRTFIRAFSLAVLLALPPAVPVSAGTLRSAVFDEAYRSLLLLPANTRFDTGGPLTIEAWIKPSGRSTYDRQTIVAHGDFGMPLGTNEGSFWFGLRGGYLEFRRGGFGSPIFQRSTEQIPPGFWTHVAVSYDGALARFYVNGEARGEFPLTVSRLGQNLPLTVGAMRLPTLDPPGGSALEARVGYGFTGAIDELRIWQRSLPAEEIRTGQWEERRGIPDLLVAFGMQGPQEDVAGVAADAVSPAGGVRYQVEGVLPRDLLVPRVAAGVTLTVDGQVLPEEYAGAEQAIIFYRPGGTGPMGQANVFLVHDEDNLYIGVRDLAPTLEPLNPCYSSAAVLIAPDGMGAPVARVSDFQIRTYMRTTNDCRNASFPEFYFGNGAGGYRPPSPEPDRGRWATAKDYGGDEFQQRPPTVEFRISRELLGNWTETDRFALVHAWIEAPRRQDFLAQPASVWNSPATWANMRYSDAEGESSFPLLVIRGKVSLPGSGWDGVTPATAWVGAPPAARQRVYLKRSSTPNTVISSTETSISGEFEFRLHVPEGVALNVEVCGDQDCRPIAKRWPGQPSISISSEIATEPIAPCRLSECRHEGLEVLVRRMPGAVVLNRVSPTDPYTETVLFDDGVGRSVRYVGQDVTVYGVNLHDQVEVHLVYRQGGCLIGISCQTALARIVERAPDETSLKVRLPPRPTVPIGGNWVIAVYDRLERPSRGAAWIWSGPITITEFRSVARNDAFLYSLGIENNDSAEVVGGDPMDPGHQLSEFDGVFGDNAYICLGALDVCACRIRDPLYLLFEPIYVLIIQSSGGSCAGMAATSQLMRTGTWSVNRDVPGAKYPAGLFGSKVDIPLMGKRNIRLNAPRARWTNPACGPRQPDNLWARVRVNHGVQLSEEFLVHGMSQMRGGVLGAGVAIAEEEQFLRGDPASRWAELQNRGTLQRTVLCMSRLGSGHCVAPASVETVDRAVPGATFSSTVNIIHLIDNKTVPFFPVLADYTDGRLVPINTMWDNSVIEVDQTANEYQYFRNDPDNFGSRFLSRRGSGLYTFPMSLWQEERHAPGLETLSKFVILFLAGIEGPDNPVDTATGLPRFGDFGAAPLYIRALPQRDATRQLTVTSKSEPITLHVADRGRVIQADARFKRAGTRATFDIASEADKLSRLTVSAQDEGIVLPRLGLSPEKRGRTVLRWSAIPVNNEQSFSIEADRDSLGATLKNTGKSAITYSLAIEVVHGPTSTNVLRRTGQLTVPPGGKHHVKLSDWPGVNHTLLEGDGLANARVTVPLVDCGKRTNAPILDADHNGVPDACEKNKGSFEGDWEVSASAVQGCIVKSWKSRLTIKGAQIIEDGAARGSITAEGSFQYTRPAPANPKVVGPFIGKIEGEAGAGTYRFGPNCSGSITLRRM